MVTVYDFARKLMKDEEFNRGGIMKNERKYIDAIGFDYAVHNGEIEYGDDLSKFFSAMCTLCELQKKYNREG